MSVETYNNRQAVVDLASSIGAKTIVEIGVRRGRLSILLAEIPTLKSLFLIDSWEKDEPLGRENLDPTKVKKNARAVKRWAKRDSRVRVLHMPSSEAARRLADGAVDFVYVDGDHSFEGVVADITDYTPKLRPGGIISGDDYDLPAVRKAVDSLVPNLQLIPNTRIWWAVK
jgi:predicted O-methyltransferase YrrM